MQAKGLKGKLGAGSGEVGAGDERGRGTRTGSGGGGEAWARRGGRWERWRGGHEVGPRWGSGRGERAWREWGGKGRESGSAAGPSGGAAALA